MSAYAGMAYRYNFTTTSAWDISSPGVLKLAVKRPDGTMTEWTPTVDGAHAAHYDAAAGELLEGLYQIQPKWQPTGPTDDVQYSPTVTVTVQPILQ